MANRSIIGWALTLLCLLARPGTGAEIVVELPEAAQVTAASAIARDLKLETAGQVTGGKITFPDLLPDVPYDLTLELADGTVLQGYSNAWHAPLDEPEESPGPATEEDRKQIDAIVTQIPQFYNRSRMLQLHADHGRAVALVELVRDKDFYAGKGEVVWRIELWYFQNQLGGWEKVPQQNRILRRERFKTHEAFHQATNALRWLPTLGGIHAPSDHPQILVTLTVQQIDSTLPHPATRPVLE